MSESNKKIAEWLKDLGTLRTTEKVKKELKVTVLEAKTIVDNFIKQNPTTPIKKDPSNLQTIITLLILVVIIWGGCKFCSSPPEPPKQQTREERIQALFSAWDGSSKVIEKAIKASLNDPNSFEHLSTKYWDLGPKIRVLTDFTAKNGYGGRVRMYVKADIDTLGNLIEIVEVNEK